MARLPSGTIRVGIGGWDYEPWRGTFYPPGLSRAKQLDYAAARLTAIEINATYYKLQKPELFAKWRDAVPEGFKFAVKGSRYCSNRRVLAEAGEAVERFCGQGFTELGDKLGPILWQLMDTKKFDPEDFRAFLALLPRDAAGVQLSHVVEPRHESFRSPEFLAMARDAGVAIAYSQADGFPSIADLSASIAYARLQCTREEEPFGYAPRELDRWAGIAQAWGRGESPPGFDYISAPGPAVPRDAYIFMIAGAKVRAPAAAMALLARL
jgi:uncharacterized protein YecE (DUF72 family)